MNIKNAEKSKEHMDYDEFERLVCEGLKFYFDDDKIKEIVADEKGQWFIKEAYGYAIHDFTEGRITLEQFKGGDVSGCVGNLFMTF